MLFLFDADTPQRSESESDVRDPNLSKEIEEEKAFVEGDDFKES